MQEHQRRILARTVDEIDAYRNGRQSAIVMFNNVWGLFEAAEVASSAAGIEFDRLYRAASSADDARQPFMPPGLGTDAEFEAALDALRAWVIRLRDPDATVG